MKEIYTIEEKEIPTEPFYEVYNGLLEELSKGFIGKSILIEIPELLKRSLTNNFRKSILAANEKINKTFSMNQAVINFIKDRDFKLLHLELIEFDTTFRRNTLQNRIGGLEFACYFDNEKDKYLLMDVEKEILLTDTVTGNFKFKNEFSNSLQPIFDDYVNENYTELGNKSKNTTIISIEKTDFNALFASLDISSITTKIIFYPIIIKERDLPLYETIGRNAIKYKDQFSLFMIGEENSKEKNPPAAYDTFCLNPPSTTC